MDTLKEYKQLINAGKLKEADELVSGLGCFQWAFDQLTTKQKEKMQAYLVG